jgi:flagellar protein FliO/FliZ
MFLAGAAAFLVAAVLIVFIFRLVFGLGRRLHMAGGRTRQPRLGVVDAFDLDRQRQLVLVRRDNVEHLIMIGGPNDILIESEIIRAEAREMPRSREKEPTVAPLSRPAGQIQLPAGPPPSIPAEPKLVPEEPAVAREQTPAPAMPLAPAPAVAPPAPTRAPFPPPPLRRPMPSPSFGPKPAAPPLGPPAEGAAATAPRAPVAPPSFLRPRPVPAAPSSPGPAVPPPVAVPEATVIIPAGAPPVTPPQPAKADKTPSQIDALESLEEEMAKLLGRGTKES